MTNVELLHRDQSFNTIRVEHDASNDTHWCFMHAQQAFADPAYRACFSPKMLRELRLFARQSIEAIDDAVAQSPTHLAHIVLASDTHVYNLGGDLSLFSNLIRAREDDLRRLLFDATDPSLWRFNLRPATPIMVAPDPRPRAFEPLVDVALAQRPDLGSQRSAVARAASAPSRSIMRCSNIATVGLAKRE